MPRYTFFCIKREHEREPFLPRSNKDKNRLETSLYLTENLSDEEIWKLGQTCVVKLAQENEHKSAQAVSRTPQTFHLRGRFDFDSDCLPKNNIALKIDIDNTPCEGHANLIGWNADPTTGKAENEDTAQRLKETCATYNIKKT